MMIDALELAVIELEQCIDRNGFLAEAEVEAVGRAADRNEPFVARNSAGAVAAGELEDEAAVIAAEELILRVILFEFEADAVADGHLENALRNAALIDGPAGERAVSAKKRCHEREILADAFRRRKAVFVLFGGEQGNAGADALEFRGGNVRRHILRDRKRNEGRGDMDVLEGAAHGVLTADRGKAETHLRVESAEQRGKGLAPARGIAAELFKVFLESEPAFVGRCAARNELCNGRYDRAVRAGVGIRFRKIGIEAVRHDGTGIGFAVSDGEFRRHRLRRSDHIPSAEGHQHGAGADGGIEPLRKTLAGADIDIGNERLHALDKTGVFYGFRRFFARGDLRLHGFRRAVGIEEFPRKIDDGAAV